MNLSNAVATRSTRGWLERIGKGGLTISNENHTFLPPKQGGLQKTERADEYRRPSAIIYTRKILFVDQFHAVSNGLLVRGQQFV